MFVNTFYASFKCKVDINSMLFDNKNKNCLQKELIIKMINFYTKRGYCIFLSLFIQGELTISSDMEDLENALFLDQVPGIWTSRAYPSLLGLTSWFADLLLRLRELETWSNDFVVRTFLNNFFNSISATVSTLS